MRTLAVTENITLDGVVDNDAGWFGIDPTGDATDQSAVLAEQAAAADAFLVGRVTFEQLREFWPAQTDDRTGVADYLDRVSKYVVSTTIGDPRWAGTRVLRGALAEEITALKSVPGKDIVTTGSVTLVRALIAAGLVDEYRLFVYPVVLGRGRRLFENATDLGRLRLVEARPFTGGVVLMRYRSR